MYNIFKIFKPDQHGQKIGIIAFLTWLYLVCMPLSVVPLPGGISLLKAISFAAGGALLAALFIGENEIKFNVLHLFLAIYTVYSVASLFLLYSNNSWTNLRGILETVLILFLMSTRIYNAREKRFLMNSWLIVGVISTAMMLAGNTQFGTEGRLTLMIGGGNEDPNQLCGYFILPILLCMEKLRKNPDKKIKALYAAFIVAMLYAVLTTGSRGGLLAVLVGMLAYFFFVIKGVKNKLKGLLALTLTAVVCMTVLLPLLPSAVRERMSVQSVMEDKGSGRVYLWRIVFRAIIETDTSLFLGYGLGSTARFIRGADLSNNVAHNHWLQVWCDQGLIGLILFLIIMLSGGLRTLRGNTVVAMSLLGMLALSMSLTLYAAYKPFWNILMMSAMNYEEE